MSIILGIKSGEISVENYRNKIRLRWRYAGNRLSLSTGLDYTPNNIKIIHKLMGETYQDMIFGQCLLLTDFSFNHIYFSPYKNVQ